VKYSEIPINTVLADLCNIRISENKTGRYSINCPFHIDTTPSFFVYAETDSAFCFGGCGYFNPTSLYAKHKGISRAEARLQLKQHFNTDDLTFEEEKEIRKLELLEKYVDSCHKCLEPSHINALNKRGYTQHTIESLRIGFHNPFISMTADELLELGVFAKGPDGSTNSHFLNKIILPGYQNFKLVYVIAWNYDHAPDSPKYIMPAGWDRPVIGTTGDTTLIVEGYHDMVSAHQAGYNCICTLSAEVTKAQKGWLKEKCLNM